MWLEISLILSVKGLSIRSLRLLIAVLVVCSRATMLAEYDVERNRDSSSRVRNTILDDTE